MKSDILICTLLVVMAIFGILIQAYVCKRWAVAMANNVAVFPEIAIAANYFQNGMFSRKY